MIRSILSSLAAVTIFIVATWLVATLVGFEFSLLATLGASLGLTLLFNIALYMMRRNRKAF